MTMTVIITIATIVVRIIMNIMIRITIRGITINNKRLPVAGATR
jgi:hypothetical protein